MNDARAEVLGRIRTAKGGTANLAEAISAWTSLPRGYRRAAGAEPLDRLKLFAERLIDYDAQVECCEVETTIYAVERALRRSAVKNVLVPQGLDIAIPMDLNRVVDDGLAVSELNCTDAVVTRCTVAIAETGTLVLQAGDGQGRRAATLVPDVHVCIVRERDVMATVPEAFDRLALTSHLPTTFVSGPSATADIEMTRIKGVHGPRTLYVVIER